MDKLVRYIGIIQARINSSRLPAKALLDLAGKTLIERVCDSVLKSKKIEKLIVATSKEKYDDILVEKLKTLNIKYFRGDLNNVLKRFYDVTQHNPAENIVRITADNPFIDGEIIDKLIDLYESTNIDYAMFSGAPKGVSAEVFSYNSLYNAYKNATDSYDLEHVTPYMKKNFNKKIFQIDSYYHYPNVEVSIDTLEDYIKIQKFYLFCTQKKLEPSIDTFLHHYTKKNILFRADSSSKIGIGHIMRDLVFAKQFPNDNIYFACIDLSGNINKNILDAGYSLIELKTNDINELVNVINENSIDFVVFDHYEIDYYYEKEVKKQTNVNILSFDDTYKKHYCDILLNHNIYADEKKYENLVPKNCEVRCGAKYTLLREEFYKIKNSKKELSSNKKIFIAIGGTDHLNINTQIIDVLDNFHNIKIDIVTSSANKNISQLKDYIKNRENVTLHIDSNEIAKLIYNADLAIVSASVTLNEVLFLKTPFIAIKTANNQNEMYQFLLNNNYPTIDIENNRDSIKQLHELVFQELYKTVNLIKSETVLYNFTKLSLNEHNLILSWRNNPQIRNWMYNSDEILIDNHLKFIDKLKVSTTVQYFLVEKDKEFIGVIDFTDIKKESVLMGLYGAPNKRGIGKYLLNSIIEYSFDYLNVKIIKAEVFANNTKAYNLYKSFNFNKTGEKIVNNKVVICMELKK